MTLSTVFVTGASGFIGSHLIPELTRRGAEIRCLVRETSDVRHLQGDNVQLVYGDLHGKRLGLSETAWKDVVASCDSVLHIAASLNRKSSKSCFNTNLRGTNYSYVTCNGTPIPRSIEIIPTSHPTYYTEVIPTPYSTSAAVRSFLPHTQLVLH